MHESPLTTEEYLELRLKIATQEIEELKAENEKLRKEADRLMTALESLRVTAMLAANKLRELGNLPPVDI